MGLFDFLKRLFASPPDGERRVDAPARTRHEPKAAPATGGKGKLSALKDAGALAEAMGLERGALLRLADPGRFVAGSFDGKLHYRLLVHPKKSGGKRMILAPKKRLKEAQRWVLREILDPVSEGPYAHGFVKGRSIATHAAEHTGRAVVVHLDIRDFFHQFTFRRVRGVFRTLGYEGEALQVLTCLCTAPIREMADELAHEAGVDWEDVVRFMRGGPRGGLHPILPQGAPTSPALANLAFRRADARFAALARQFGATYSRYADDLVFSGDDELRKGLRRFLPLARAIVKDEGMSLTPHKLGVTRKGARQKVCGLVVNERVNVPAIEAKRLRAIVHNCVVHGPSSQNRENQKDFRAHLRGRIEFVRSANPEKGQKLLNRFGEIDWAR